MRQLPQPRPRRIELARRESALVTLACLHPSKSGTGQAGNSEHNAALAKRSVSHRPLVTNTSNRSRMSMNLHTLSRRLSIACGLTIALAANAIDARRGSLDASAYNGFDIGNASVPVQAIERGGPPKDAIPAIDSPRFVSARQSGLTDDDRVLGVALQGAARAYPVRILNWHEVVNDRFGDRAVVVTYSPRCGAGMAFEARPGAAASSFGVSGLLYNGDALLYDRATQSLWSPLLQAAVSGPLVGARLQPVPLTHTSWAGWRSRHPGTEVLSTDTGFERDYRRDPWIALDAPTTVPMAP